MSNILDLDPLAFAAALDELGLPAEEQTRLRQLYQQKSSPLAGVKEAVAPEEGRNTSNYLPVSVPEDMSIAEGVTSGNWDWAVPEGLSETASTLFEGVEAPGQILSGVPFSEQEMQAAAFKTAPLSAPLTSLRSVLEKERSFKPEVQPQEAFDTEFENLSEEDFQQLKSSADSDILQEPEFDYTVHEDLFKVPEKGDLQGAVSYLESQLRDSKSQGYGDWKDDQKIEFLSYPYYQEWLKQAAEALPHYNDRNYFNFLEKVSDFAAKEGFAPTAIQELLFDLSPWTSTKKDPEKAFFAETEMPYAAPIGERAAEQARPGVKFPERPSDPKAEALGFKEHVYHTTASPTEFNKFDLSMGIVPGEKRAAQDYLGVHVGTPRAAGERFVSTKNYRENLGRDSSGFTMELRARTDKPASMQALREEFGFDFWDAERPKDATPDILTEDELNSAIRQYARQIFGKDLPEDAYELAAIAWRKDLASRGFTHIPYMNDIEDPTSTSYIMLVDRPKGSPAVLRDVRAQFDPKKINNPDLRFAGGGMVQGTDMKNDMTKLFAEGGINTGDAKVDPVSGNEVPPGSLPEEVRDDVDAKLSGGEYVVPADVLRFYGVKFFEQLRRKAKEGLAEMDAEGRIGGDSEEAPEMPEEEEEEDLPFGEDELMFEDDGEEMEFNAGGVVPPGGIKTFDPNQFYAGFSVFGDQPVQTPVAPPAPVPAPAPVSTAEPTPRPQESWADRQTTSPSAGNSQTRQNANQTPDWATGKNWSGMTPEEATQLASERLAGNKLLSAGAQLAGVVNPFLGMAAGAAVNLRPYAEANAIEKVLRAQGNTAAADAVAKMTDDKLADAKLGTRTLEPLLANGSMLAKNILGAKPQTSQRAQAPAAKSSQGSSSGNTSLGTRTSQESWADKQTSGGTKDRSTISRGTVSNGNATISISGNSNKKSSSTKKATGGLIERRKK